MSSWRQRVCTAARGRPEGQRSVHGGECGLQSSADPRGRGQCREVSVDYSPAQTRGAEVSGEGFP